MLKGESEFKGGLIGEPERKGEPNESTPLFHHSQSFVSDILAATKAIQHLKTDATDEERIEAEAGTGETRMKDKIRDGGNALLEEAETEEKDMPAWKKAGKIIIEGTPKAVRAGGVDALRGTVMTIDQSKELLPTAIGTMVIMSRFNAMTSALFAAAQLAFLYKQYYDGKITGRQFIKKGIIVVVANCGGWAGAALGAMLGSFLPGIGTVIGSILGAFGLSILSSCLIKNGLEYLSEESNWSWSDKQQFAILSKIEYFRQALEFFGLSEYCTETEAREAKKRYYLAYHPDKVTDPELKKVYEQKFLQAFEYYAVIKIVRNEQNWAPRRTWRDWFKSPPVQLNPASSITQQFAEEFVDVPLEDEH